MLQLSLQPRTTRRLTKVNSHSLKRLKRMKNCQVADLLQTHKKWWTLRKSQALAFINYRQTIGIWFFNKIFWILTVSSDKYNNNLMEEVLFSHQYQTAFKWWLFHLLSHKFSRYQRRFLLNLSLYLLFRLGRWSQMEWGLSKVWWQSYHWQTIWTASQTYRASTAIWSLLRRWMRYSNLKISHSLNTRCNCKAISSPSGQGKWIDSSSIKTRHITAI